MKSRREKAEVSEYLPPLFSFGFSAKTYESIFFRRPFKSCNNILFHPCSGRIQITRHTRSTFELLGRNINCWSQTPRNVVITNVSDAPAGGVGLFRFLGGAACHVPAWLVILSQVGSPPPPSWHSASLHQMMVGAPLPDNCTIIPLHPAHPPGPLPFCHCSTCAVISSFFVRPFH